MYKLFAVFVGAEFAVMVTLNSMLSKTVGDYPSLLVVHLVGMIITALILIIKRKKVSIKNVPIGFMLGGVAGCFVVLFNNIAIKAIGVSLTLALCLFGQSIVSGLIDNYGLFGMTVHKFKKEKIIGFVIIAAGLVVMSIS